ncbi:MAG: type II toxin-antitoxin system VapC family toxin [Mycobacteriales bacterium]
MITAVDTNILVDVVEADATYGPRSAHALKRCLNEGQLLLSEVVWAETTAYFSTLEAAHHAIFELGAEFSPLNQKATDTAGQIWRKYRRAGGPRTRIIADFMIGAHAAVHADRLITRDRGFYRHYFPKLDIINPTETVQ